MKLTTGDKFDRILLEPYHGLIVEFQPDGENALSGLPKIEFAIGYIELGNGQIGLSIQLPSESAFRSGAVIVLVNDKLNSKKIVLQHGLELEKLT